jgi:hypothetical protein
MGVTGPWGPDTSKWARRTVKKPVINVDNLEDAGDRTVPSLVTDLAASVFAIQNVANVLVMESASKGPSYGFMSRSLQAWTE